MKRISLITSIVLFIVLCVSTSFWVLQFMKPEARKIVAPPVAKPVASVESVAGLFGGALAVNSNYQLKGIVLANPTNQSEAIVAVDGKAPQAVTVNKEISPGVKLSEVHSNYVLILDNGVSKRVDLPLESKASGQIASVLETIPTRPALSIANGNQRNRPQPQPPPVPPRNPNE